MKPITSSAPSGWRNSLPKKPLIWSAAVLATLTILAFSGLAPLVKSLLTKSLSATLHRGVSIQKVRINPLILSVRIVRDQDYSYNFSDLLATDPSKESSPAGPPLFSLNSIQIVDGSVDFRIS